MSMWDGINAVGSVLGSVSAPYQLGWYGGTAGGTNPICIVPPGHENDIPSALGLQAWINLAPVSDKRTQEMGPSYIGEHQISVSGWLAAATTDMRLMGSYLQVFGDSIYTALFHSTLGAWQRGGGIEAADIGEMQYGAGEGADGDCAYLVACTVTVRHQY
jgi:hypothetical protein